MRAETRHSHVDFISEWAWTPDIDMLDTCDQSNNLLHLLDMLQLRQTCQDAFAIFQ